jgi:hypothetical protein
MNTCDILLLNALGVYSRKNCLSGAYMIDKFDELSKILIFRIKDIIVSKLDNAAVANLTKSADTFTEVQNAINSL